MLNPPVQVARTEGAAAARMPTAARTDASDARRAMWVSPHGRNRKARARWDNARDATGGAADRPGGRGARAPGGGGVAVAGVRPPEGAGGAAGPGDALRGDAFLLPRRVRRRRRQGPHPGPAVPHLTALP